jgi:hypothetical protein
MNSEIAEKQKDHMRAKEESSAFITFATLAAAHKAAQIKLPRKNYVAFNLERTLAPKPAEVIWGNLGISYPERIVQFAVTTAFVISMITFWTIPVAVVGSISNINYLTNKVHFLDFILNFPPSILGLITGLLPSIMLTVLMALLPIILRCIPLKSSPTFSSYDLLTKVMAKWGGVPTMSRVELAVQNTYFLFQVILMLDVLFWA